MMAGFEIQIAFDIPFYLYSKDQFLLDRMKETAQHFLGPMEVPPAVQKVKYLDKFIVNVEEGFKPSSTNKLFPGFNFQIIHTPGHSPGSVSFYFPKEKVVFSGDVIFAGGGYGRTDFSYCSSSDLQKSIQKLFKLPDETVVYSGHGGETTIGEEKEFY